MIDQQFFLLIHNLAGKSRLLDFFGIFFADYLGYFLILFTLFFLWSIKDQRQRMRALFFLALSLILSRGILTELIRYFYHRSRPFSALGFEPLIGEVNQGAFPSGHAAFYFALAIAVYFLDQKKGKYLLAAAAVIGLARIFVGVHWPMDIVGGALAALFSVLAVKQILDK